VDAQNPGGVYFSFKNCSRRLRNDTLARIAQRPSIAHNAQFEQFMIYNTIQEHANIKYDTQALLNQIEGDYVGSHGSSLKPLQTSLLNWEDQGDVELDEWLTNNGYVNSRGKVLKGEMHRAPDKILGKYCNLDSQSTWDIFHQTLAPVLEQYPDLAEYHSRDFQNLIKLIDEGRRHGVYVLKDQLERYQKILESTASDCLRDFYETSEVRQALQSLIKIKEREHYDKVPPKKTKTGKISARYLKWEQKLRDISKEEHFNPNSKKQLAWLFYDEIFETQFHWELKKDWRGRVWKDKYGRVKKSCTLTVNDKTFKWDSAATENELSIPSRKCDKEILPHLGEAGKALAAYNKHTKELSYIDSMLSSLKNSTHHTQLRVSGTKTDRCAGTGGVNIQQLPKAYGYLSCLQAHPGNNLIQMDVDALEPVVLAELSQCPSYMKLYGPGRPPNDVYLFIGSQIPLYKEEILNAGYDPEKPTAEGIKAAKKKCKRIRSICKVIHLSAGYGAGADKIYDTLIASGISITLQEVITIREMYWKVFEGVVKFRERLESIHQANRGFYEDGLGTPVSVHRDYRKDILNRCIQRTGHMILVKYLYHLTQIRKENRAFDMLPVVVDFHDETVWQAPKELAHKYSIFFHEAWERTNKELGGIIPLTGDPMVCKSFADFKCEE